MLLRLCLRRTGADAGVSDGQSGTDVISISILLRLFENLNVALIPSRVIFLFFQKQVYVGLANGSARG